MEQRQTVFGEPNPGQFTGLIDLLVEEGRERFREEADIPTMLGRLDALDICEEMKDGDFTDFELVSILAGEAGIRKHLDYQAERISHEEWVRHRAMITEFASCREVLRAAHVRLYGKQPGLPEYARQTASHHAIENYEALSTKLEASQ
jgi:hypothetical protein